MNRMTSVFSACLLAGFLVGCCNVLSDSEPKPMSRQDFAAKVVGKNGDEVIAAVGRPQSTSVSGRDEYWYYRWRTIDPRTGKPEWTAQVVFEDGIVIKVRH